MNTIKLPVTIIALLTFFATLLVPVASVSAASVNDLLPQAATTGSNSSGGSNTLVNILLGLLMGNFLGKLTNNQSNAPAEISKLPADISSGLPTNIAKVLGAATGSGLPAEISKVIDAATGSNNTSSVKGAQLIETAKTLIGVPYVFGGNSVTTGLDCSSFTQYVMKQNGITIPRTAAEQFATGTPVEKSNLKIGDLVFFETYKAGASHVGFYMGDGNFIHESSALGQVGISALNDQYYVERYLGARRYIK